ncbi:uncharacterized protein LOC143276886 [Babylonia areolata]|uniref:uncharacterized protein LOC143276886 n=1 Tax=Babylonia areolata TaxID=304850 RepID=UPI003FD21898
MAQNGRKESEAEWLNQGGKGKLCKDNRSLMVWPCLPQGRKRVDFFTAADEYLKVCRPLRRQMSRKHVKISLLLILTVALIFAFPVVLVYGIRSTDIDNVPIPGHDCSTSDHVKGTVFPLVYNSVLFLLFITFLIILTVIYVRIWREMKRHRLYMARNSMPGGGSRFNFSSVSEPSSEARQDCRGRRLTLPGESSDEAVLVQSGQPGRSATGSRGQKAGRKESGASDHAPSVKSDTTLCEAEQDLSDVDDTEQQGSGNASTGTETQAPEDAKKESQHAQSIRIDDGDCALLKVNRTVQQTSSDDAADSSADRGTLANPQTAVKAGQGPGNSVNSICSEDTAQKRPSQTEADQTNVRDVLETVAAQTIVSQRKVTKSRSVSEVKSHKATIIAMSVTVVFFLSFVPHLSLITLRTINKQFEDNLEGAGLVLYNIFLRSYFINSVTNPFIYGVLNSRFRAECLRLFRRLLCCRKPVS